MGRGIHYRLLDPSATPAPRSAPPLMHLHPCLHLAFHFSSRHTSHTNTAYAPAIYAPDTLIAADAPHGEVQLRPLASD